MLVLECKKVKFYSEIDELIFFESIKRFACVKNYQGKGSAILLYIKSKQVSKQELLGLIALFSRYKISMKQLRVFLTEQNKSWFNAKGTYWYTKIF